MIYGFPARFLKQILPLFFCVSLLAQVQQEVNPPSNIKSIVFVGENEEPFPIIQLGESIYLEFDDMLANEQDYYYKLVHCDYDWTPSQLLKSQYLGGLDNQRIIDYENSLTTLKPYSNYRLTIPNFNTRLKVSGNWMLEIYNNYNELQFSRRFVVYRDQVAVGVVPKRSRDFNFLDEKQAIQITINGGSFQLLNPKREVKIAVLKNYYWPSAITDIPPQFVLGNLLEYKYDKEISFFGGNEFLNFDTSNLRAPSSRISSSSLAGLRA